MQVDRTRMYRVSAVAKLLDVSPSTVYRAVESGVLDGMRIGSAVRIPGTALALWLNQCREDALSVAAAARGAADEHNVIGGQATAELAAAGAEPLPVELAAAGAGAHSADVGAVGR